MMAMVFHLIACEIMHSDRHPASHKAHDAGTMIRIQSAVPNVFIPRHDTLNRWIIRGSWPVCDLGPRVHTVISWGNEEIP